jgi:NADH-quinone oxidoreductase subunit M
MTVVAFLCLGNILFCGLVAIRQKDLNYLIGNSSVAHMGLIFLGIASLNLIGVTGAVLVMVAHGLLAALSFGLSGYLYNKTGTLQMEQMGGLLQRLPFIGAALVMAMLAGCGLPGFANFAGEILVLFGAWSNLTCIAVCAAWGGLVIGAVYMLRAVRSVLHGPLPEKFAATQDGDFLDKLTFSVLLAALLALGCWPRLLTDKIQPSAEIIVRMANGLPEKPAKHVQSAAAPAGPRPAGKTPRVKP